MPSAMARTSDVYKRQALTKGENIVRFNKKLIDATKAVAGCYKVQIAYYESCLLYTSSLAIWMASSAPRVETWHMCSLVW